MSLHINGRPNLKKTCRIRITVGALIVRLLRCRASSGRSYTCILQWRGWEPVLRRWSEPHPHQLGVSERCKLVQQSLGRTKWSGLLSPPRVFVGLLYRFVRDFSKRKSLIFMKRGTDVNNLCQMSLLFLRPQGHRSRSLYLLRSSLTVLLAQLINWCSIIMLR